MFSYGQIEKALAALHDAGNDAALKTFRSRIKHFQRIGIVPSAPGKGQRLSYTIADAVYWALCFDMAELGLAPSLIKAIMELNSYNLVTFFTGYSMQRAEYYFLMAGSFMSWHLSKEGSLISGMLGFSIGKKADLDKSLAKSSRLLLINLTSLKRNLGQSLDHDWRDDESAWELSNVGKARPRAGDPAGPHLQFR